MYRFLIPLLISFVSCNRINENDKKIYYFYDQSKSYQYEYSEDDTLIFRVYCWIRKPEKLDSFYIGDQTQFYSLISNYHKNKSLKEDTFFIKGYNYLDSIRYFDSKWLSNEKNLIEFWKESSFGANSDYDSLLIFMAEQYMNSDSLIFRRVHRFFDRTTD